MHSPLTFGVVGYSTRALVQALVDLGQRAIAIDAFGDQDTLDLAEAVHVIDDWPGGITRSIELNQVDAWLLGGGVENCETLLIHFNARIGECVGKMAPVLGPTSDQMRTLRSLKFLEDVCDEGVAWPTTTIIRPEHDLAQWLIKPLRSAGGVNVFAAHAVDGDAFKPGTYYWQRRLAGRVLGVTWIFFDQSCKLHGITESLAEHDWPGASQFIYRGSLGPIELDECQLAALAALGQRIRTTLPHYRGYLQADLILDTVGQLWLIEFNPRWTAGMEVLHESAQVPHESPLYQHLRAWNIEPCVAAAWTKPQTRLVSKAVYYCAHDIELSQSARRKLQSLRHWQSSARGGAQWCIADLPPVTPTAPMRFEAGSPILTIKSRLLTSSN